MMQLIKCKNMRYFSAKYNKNIMTELNKSPEKQNDTYNELNELITKHNNHVMTTLHMNEKLDMLDTKLNTIIHANDLKFTEDNNSIISNAPIIILTLTPIIFMVLSSKGYF